MEVKVLDLYENIPTVAIPVTRFEALVMAEVKVNMLKDLCENEKYVLDSDIRRIVGMGEKKDEN